MKHIKDGIFYVVLGVFAIGVGMVCGSFLGNWGEGPVLFLFAMGGISFFAAYLSFTSKRRKEKREKEEQERQQQMQQEKLQKQQEERQKRQEAIRLEKERIDKINNEMKEGLWKFPAAKFYQLCRDGQATVLDNEFSIRKATHIAQQLILERDSKIDLNCCEKYLSIDGLNRFLEEGKNITSIAEREALLRQKQPKDAKAPTETEQTFLARSKKLATLSGCEKRVQMLKDMICDYDAEIKAKREGEAALKQLGMIYASQQKKESDWAVMGGIAEGIAGSAAGIMVAANAMANNSVIRDYNACIRKASMDIMSGVPSIAGDRYKLEKEREEIQKHLDVAKDKISITKPSAKEIWENITLSNVSVKKNTSGVLSVSATMDLIAPFNLDIPGNVHMVVDGTIRGDVYCEDVQVGCVYLPLPLYGVPANKTVNATLDGMCGRSVEYDGEYTVKFGDTQNLWIMECQSRKLYPLTPEELMQVIYTEMKKGKGYSINFDKETLNVALIFQKPYNRSSHRVEKISGQDIRSAVYTLEKQGKLTRTKDENDKGVYWKN